ncbi:MAG: phage major capsid protein [Clostridiales bacterium]|nr:phage major capsid protein [Clostridiales bacterium]
MELKKLMEQRAAKQAEMKAMLDKAGAEERALNKDERESFDKLESEIRDLDGTINAIQAQRDIELNAPKDEAEDDKGEATESAESTDEAEERAFADYIRGNYDEIRSAVNMTKGDNGAVIPSSIANKIIEEIIDICPIFADADRYNVKGTLSIPYYDEGTSAIQMEYADEFTDGESKSGKFLNITLTGYLGRAICDVSKSLINNSQFDIVSFVVKRMALAAAKFIEGELLNGTTDKIDGLSTLTPAVVTADKSKVTVEELIDLQESIPDAYQGNAYWIMNKKTRTAIRKFKTAEGEFILNRDLNSRWGYTLLGKDVYCSDAVAELGTASKDVIFYGDMKGLAVKVSEDINIEVLRETQARRHAVEVLGFVELDAKVQNAQMVSKMTTKAS